MRMWINSINKTWTYKDWDLSINVIVTETGTVNFDSFCRVAGHFLENEDDEALQKELKEAFRLYDKEGKNY